MKALKTALSLICTLILFSSLAACGEKGASNIPSKEAAGLPASKTAEDGQPGEGPKILVAYFSCTGHTKTLAFSVAGLELIFTAMLKRHNMI